MAEAADHARKFRKELLSGTLALVLLSVLSRAGGELYGYDIAKRLAHFGRDEPLFKQSAIYPVLRNMSAAGLLASRVQPSASGPPRRYYRITKEGEAALRDWRGIWTSLQGFVDMILEGQFDGGSHGQ